VEAAAKAAAAKAVSAEAAASPKPAARSAAAAPVARHAHDKAPPLLRQPRGSPEPVHAPQRPLRPLRVGEDDEREALGPARLAVGHDADGLDGVAAAAAADPGGGVERAEGFERGLRRGDVEALFRSLVFRRMGETEEGVSFFFFF